MLSDKLMTMKFMSKSTDQTTDTIARSKEATAINNSHWRLDFRDVAKTAIVPDLEVITSYTAFQDTSSGRRNYRKDTLKTEEQDPENDLVTSETDEAPEDAHARRQSEKAADKDNLRSMKGMKTLSGSSANNKRKDQDVQKPKHKKHKR